MPSFNEEIEQLIKNACQYPPKTKQRQYYLTKLLRIIIKSDRLWRENTPYYEDARQKTFLHLCRNLCESYTGNQYNPEISNIFTWLNNYLRWRLRDLANERRQLELETAIPRFDDTEYIYNWLENIEAPPSVPPILENIYDWAEKDETQKLRNTQMKDRSDINAQMLILRRLPPERSWKQISAELNSPVSSLSAFYQRKCLPLLRNFGKSQGYLSEGHTECY